MNAQAQRNWTPAGVAPSGGVQTFASPSVSLTDPTGDVVDRNGNVVNEPHGDIVAASSGADSHSSIFTLTVDTPTNPASDPNWDNDTGPLWLIDTNYNKTVDYIAAEYRDAARNTP